MKLRWYGCLAAAALSLTGIAPALADSNSDRLDRVERELNQLQRQVYRSEVGTALPTTPGAPEPGGSTGALDIQIRMDQIEAQMRTLTGKLEEIEYNIGQLQGRLDKKQSDDELRFQQLENASVSQPTPPANQVKPARAAIAPPAGPPATDMSRGPGDFDSAPAAPAQTAAAAVPAAGVLPNGSVQDQYNYAFGVLRRGEDYAAAEAAFKAFIQKHPTDPLAANAQYWLGETYFVRKDYPSAASAFAEGFRKYPQGAKAPDTLLKLGMSLGNEGKKDDACLAFAQLERNFPTVGASTKDRMASEKKRYGC
ncbi:MAG TPA: tol-pal system protein YbgF [Stellaceae bacterium]|nr:tol-pal system protein YbgF [Stellaceae bacterium]